MLYNRRRQDGLAIARREQQGPGGQPLQVHTTESFFQNHDFIVDSFQRCRSGMFIPDPNFHPGSRVKKIPDPGTGSASKTLSIFHPKNIVSKLSEM
jgi:hypothetical protein